MATIASRDYNCKDEELPVICKFVAFSLEQDQPVFGAYSPIYSTDYVVGFKNKIASVEELMNPKSEAVARKKKSDLLFSTIIGLSTPLNHLEGYLNLAYDEIQLTPAEFGLTALRKGINVHDPERVISNLRAVIKNAEKYTEVLTTKGFSDTLMQQLTQSLATIETSKQQQYEISVYHKSLVQNNRGELNGLHKQLTIILKTGRILFKGNNPVKVKEYTFTELKKRVHRINHKTDEPVIEPQAVIV